MFILILNFINMFKVSIITESSSYASEYKITVIEEYEFDLKEDAMNKRKELIKKHWLVKVWHVFINNSRYELKTNF